MEELEKKFQELKLELAAYKRDRFWLAVVGGVILAFLGFTNFFAIPREVNAKLPDAVQAQLASDEGKKQISAQVGEAFKSIDRTSILEELVVIKDQALTSAAEIEEEKARASNAGRDISNLLTQLSGTVDDWEDIKPKANWGAYDYEGWPNPSYIRDKLGFVHLRGLVVLENADDAGKKNPITVLPDGFQPQVWLEFTVACQIGGETQRPVL
jgi:NOL1/NOP2/fmu family ribosome biogenesis protein